VSYMTYFSENISLEMWSLWPLMMSALDDWAIDFFESKYKRFPWLRHVGELMTMFV
jgi:hypothetical protein